ncbi:hypothetical protein BHM03_00047445 [Ensete ventricosum]|nr:hypothetical protein BHM03_00047445 [Ensete ventricosum]
MFKSFKRKPKETAGENPTWVLWFPISDRVSKASDRIRVGPGLIQLRSVCSGQARTVPLSIRTGIDGSLLRKRSPLAHGRRQVSNPGRKGGSHHHRFSLSRRLCFCTVSAFFGPAARLRKATIRLDLVASVCVDLLCRLKFFVFD